MQSKHLEPAHCANRTCGKPIERVGPQGGHPREYCSRACQLAARNATHRKSLQVEVDMDAYHTLVAEARAEGVPVNEVLRWALDDYLLL